MVGGEREEGSRKRGRWGHIRPVLMVIMFQISLPRQNLPPHHFGHYFSHYFTKVSKVSKYGTSRV